MAAVAYLMGDPAKVDVADVGVIGGPAGPLDGSGLIPSAQIPGGGGGTPSGTVAAETSYGISSAAGSAAAYSRGDHTHGSPALTSSAATASAVGDTAAAGTATTPARADHLHGREAFGTATAQTSYGASSGNGAATTPARSDHTHGTPSLTSSAASSSAVGDAAAVGTATTPARGDHVHGRESFGVVTAQTAFNAASANGSAATPARSDHVHGTPPLATFPAILGSDLTTTSTTLANTTGLSLALAIGTFEFDFYIVWQGSVGGGSTTGLGPNLQLTGTGGLVSSALQYTLEIQTSASTLNLYVKTALSAAQAPGAGAQTANSPYLIRMRGRIVVTTGGTLQPQHAVASGLGAGTLTIKAGSYAKLQSY